jgi:hypothetical protein
MSNSKLFLHQDSPPTSRTAPSAPAKGATLISASYEAGGDQARDENTKAALEKAGYELPEPELPAVDETLASTPQQAHETLQRNIQRYGRQVEQQAKAKYPDWKQVVGGADVFIGREAQVALLETDNATDVVYYLATHQEEAKRLGRIGPVAAIKEVARISASLPKPEGAERARRPAQATLDSLTFQELAKMPTYPGKARDLRRCRG